VTPAPAGLPPQLHPVGVLPTPVMAAAPFLPGKGPEMAPPAPVPVPIPLAAMDVNPMRPAGLTQAAFAAKLSEYWSARPGLLPPDGTRIGGVLVGWWFLYHEVEDLGGIAVVVRKKLFSKIVKKLDIPPTITSGSYELRKLYDRFLFPVLAANAWIDPAYVPAHKLHPSQPPADAPPA